MKQKVELVIINIIKVYFDFYRLFISDIKKKQLVRIKVDSKTKNKTIEYFGKEKLNLVK